MTRTEFMDELGARLTPLEAREREELLNYYLEYFEDRGIAADDTVPADVTEPSRIATEILHDMPFSQTEAGQASAKAFEPISTTTVSELDIKLNLGGLEVELADVETPELQGPKNAKGLEENYELTVEVEGTKLIIRDSFQDNWLQSHKRFNLDPVVLRLPRNTKLEKAVVDLKMGSTKLFGIDCTELKLKNALGSIHLNNSEIESLSGRLDMGSIKLDNVTVKSSDFQVAMGDFRGQATLLGKHKIQCDMGSVRLDLKQSHPQTKIRSRVTMGSFRVNGQTVACGSGGVGGDFDSGKSASVIADLDLKVTMGSINLNFV